MSTAPIFSQLERYLSVTNKRETVIAANMANIDTPGYHTQDVSFQQALTASAATSGSGDVKVAVKPVKGLLERPDGNNVDMDRESMLLAESQLSYGMGTQLLKSRFHQLLTAINEGGTA